MPEGHICGKCKLDRPTDDFYVRRTGKLNPWCKACYREWYLARHQLKRDFDPSPRACAQCGETYEPKQRRPSIHCSRRCKDKARAVRTQAAIDEAKPERFCLHCGTLLPRAQRADAIYCSAQCNDAAHAITRKIAKRAGTPRDKAPLSRAFIGERDGWRCGICGGKVNPKLRHPDALAPSVDHIVPLARGGTNEIANLQMSHLRCNLSKRAAMN